MGPGEVLWMSLLLVVRSKELFAADSVVAHTMHCLARVDVAV